jgi:23S rRNA G2069 N7-methylase RlmK/C1962 C5-methylase RlmI
VGEDLAAEAQEASAFSRFEAGKDLFAAAVEARVRVSLLGQLGAAPDHPIAITHPQGEYLKGWLACVTGPVI